MQQHPLHPKESSFFKALRAARSVQLQITAAVTRCYPAVLTDSFAKGTFTWLVRGEELSVVDSRSCLMPNQ